MPLSNRQQSLIDDLGIIDDPQERLSAVVDRAKRRPALPEAARTEDNRIAGCQSQVWIVADRVDGHLKFIGDSDSPLVRGLVTFTCDFFSDESAEAVAASTETEDPIALLGLSRNLSPTRQNGLVAVRARLRELARRLLRT